MSIRENRVINIDNRIISVKNINDLARILDEEYQLEIGVNENTRLLFSVKCFDSTSFESETLELFDENSILNKKRVKSISLHFYGENNKAIKIRLNHGYIIVDDEKVSDSDIEVSGNDSFWVSGVIDKINTIIESCSPQNSVILSNENRILRASILVGMLTAGFAFDLVSTKNDDHVPFWIDAFTSFGDFVAAIIATFFFGGLVLWALVHNMTEKAFDLWPPIELQIGPEHSFIERRKRKILYYLISLFIIPSLISILTAILM